MSLNSMNKNATLKLECDGIGKKGQHPVVRGGRALASVPRQGVVVEPRAKYRGSAIQAIKKVRAMKKAASRKAISS